ncbi:hypothetical protein EON65_07345 [archaeon]|nr:MAG: hypothetical protein EON65_07345 [archaeon]
MDLAGAVSPDECMDELGLDLIRDRAWQIKYAILAIIMQSYYFLKFFDCLRCRASNAITGAGIDEGIEWLCQAIARKGK